MKKVLLLTYLFFTLLKGYSQCPNLDFSYGNFTNWQGYLFRYGEDKILTELPYINFHTIMNAAQLQSLGQFYDEHCNFISKVPNGFNYAVRFASPVFLILSRSAIEYTMTIDSTNALLTVHIAWTTHANLHNADVPSYIAVQINDSLSGQLCNGLKIEATELMLMDTMLVLNWTPFSFDLSPFFGQTIKVFVEIKDIEPFYAGYAPPYYAVYYFVAECRGLGVTPIEPTEERVCPGQNTARLKAPLGFTSYYWTRSSNPSWSSALQQANVPNPLDNEIITVNNGGCMEFKYIIKKTSINPNFLYGVMDSSRHVPIRENNYENWYDTCNHTATFVDFSSVTNSMKDSILWEIFNPSDSVIASSKDSMFTYTFSEIPSCQPALTYRVRLTAFASDSVCYGIDTMSRYVTIFPLPADTLTIEDTICPNNAYNLHGFNILESELQTEGRFEFRDTLTSAKGCDSLIILQLTVFPKPADTLIIEDSLCPNNAYNLHGFNILASELQTAGMFEFQNMLTSSRGCDSLILLRLNVSSSYFSTTNTIYDTICSNNAYNRHGFNILASELQTAGMFEFQNMLTSSKGCDSLILLKLSVLPEPSIQLFVPAADTLFVCEGEEASMEVQASGKDLVYQWYRNGAPLSGTVNSCYLIPSVSQTDFGAYYVEVSGFCGSVKSGVLFLSECILDCLPFDQIVKMRWNNTLTVINNPANNGGYRFTSFKWYRNDKKISEEQSWSVSSDGEWLNPDDEFYVELTAEGYSEILRTCKSKIVLQDILKVYPNPTRGELIIESGGSQIENVTLYDVMGQSLMTLRTVGTIETLDISHLAKGMYFLKIQTPTETFMQKVVRE
jgi:hypothetical protein